MELGLGMTSLETWTVHHGLIFRVPDQIALSKDDDLKTPKSPRAGEDSAACMQIPRQARLLTRENLEAGIIQYLSRQQLHKASWIRQCLRLRCY